MRNVYEVLQEKENAVQRVAREIEILRLAAPLLTDDAPTQNVRFHDAHTTNDAHTNDLHAPGASDNAFSDIRGHDIPDADANTGILSVPSLVANESGDEEGEGGDEANSAAGKKISARLKRLARPLVSLVAG